MVASLSLLKSSYMWTDLKFLIIKDKALSINFQW